MFVKDGEGSEIFSTLKLLACQNLIDAGRRHVTSESETKHFITHNKASNISFMFASGTLAHGGNAEHPRWTCHNKGTPKQREPRSLTMGLGKPA